MNDRTVKIEERATAKLAQLAARGKKAKERGEEGAMQNLFLNMLLPMSLQAGQDSRGFMAGALKGAQDNMDSFVDRFTELKDNFATGEEKRDREKTGIEDKQISDVFELEDVFNTRRDALNQEHFTLTEKIKNEKSTVGMSKRQAALNEKRKEVEYMQQSVDAASKALALKKEAITDINTMARENAATLTDILDLDLFDATKTTGALKNQKDFNNKIESIRKANLDKMNFTLGPNDEIMTKDKSPLKQSDLEKYTLAFEREKRQFLQDMVRLGTSYPSQAIAMLKVEESRSAGNRTKYDSKGKKIK